MSKIDCQSGMLNQDVNVRLISR